MATKRQKIEAEQHEMETWKKRMNDVEGREAFPEWGANPITDDPTCKFVLTFWGSMFTPRFNRPVDLYMMFDRETKRPMFITVAGNSSCDIRTIESSNDVNYLNTKTGKITGVSDHETEMFETLGKAMDLLDMMLVSYYAKPINK